MPCKALVKRCKTISEAVDIGFDLTDVCAKRWAPRQVYGLDEVVRPSIAKESGYQYRITTAGQTGTKEPNWAQATVSDGSAVWAREAISNDSLLCTIVAVTWDGDGLTITDEQEVITNGEQQIAAKATGGTVGKHLVSALVEFSDGKELEYRQEITVNL